MESNQASNQDQQDQRKYTSGNVMDELKAKANGEEKRKNDEQQEKNHSLVVESTTNILRGFVPVDPTKDAVVVIGSFSAPDKPTGTFVSVGVKGSFPAIVASLVTAMKNQEEVRNAILSAAHSHELNEAINEAVSGLSDENGGRALCNLLSKIMSR